MGPHDVYVMPRDGCNGLFFGSGGVATVTQHDQKIAKGRCPRFHRLVTQCFLYALSERSRFLLGCKVMQSFGLFPCRLKS